VPLLNHVVEGAGPTVLLLHAGVADLRMWDAQATELRRDHTVVRCDLRGYGGSPLPAGGTCCDAEDVVALLEHLGVGRFALVAASYGGHVGLQVASSCVERVDRTVLLSPLAEVVPPDDGLRALWAEEERLVGSGDLDAAAELNVRTWLGPEADEPARELLRAMQHDVLVQQVAADEVENRELEVALDRLTMPTTVVAGLRDLRFFVDSARELVRLLPAAHLVELEWAGHLPSLERPAQTARLVRSALSAGRD
jgi:pimeloyl-ACP methyl ester carboxylesterase